MGLWGRLKETMSKYCDVDIISAGGGKDLNSSGDDKMSH